MADEETHPAKMPFGWDKVDPGPEQLEERIAAEVDNLISQAKVETKPFRFRNQDNAIKFVMDVWDLVEGVDCERDDRYIVNLVKRRIT